MPTPVVLALSSSTWRDLAWAYALAGAVMLAVWIVQAMRRDATLVDVAWAANLALIAALYAILSDGLPLRRVAIAALAAAWALRLAGHLLVNRAIGRPEDGRYRSLRERWGVRAQRNFFLFFQAQALLDVVLSIPLLVIASNPAPAIGAIEWVGLALGVIAIGGESLADRQLARFKRKSAAHGRTCRDGLWRYSRHPNYFFEWLVWVAFALIAAPAPHGWLGCSGPTLMLYLLWNVTGIPANEAQAVKSRGQDYVDYQRTTSAFVPWFPRQRDRT